MKNYKKIKTNKKGSAMIMAIAIVTMLAVVGAVFLLVSRMDEAASSSVTEFKALDNAVDSVIAEISTQLKLDTPGVDPNQEYYDYPGDRDKWLASLEPYDDGGTYTWMQISDVFEDFNDLQHQDIDPQIVNDNEAIDVDAYGIPNNTADTIADADADGDGVADAKWVRLDNVSSSTGQPLYAAIRVIDNSAMINVNTAYEFDPNETNRERINGRWITQIDLEGLKRIDEVNDIEDFHEYRVDTNSIDLHNFRYYMQVNSFNANNTNFTPFDISDELELRNRFFLSNEPYESRVENAFPKTIANFTTNKAYYVPIGQSKTINDWYNRMWLNETAPDDEKDRRHLVTTYNADRYITPSGSRSLVLNNTYVDPNIGTIYNRLENYFDKKVTNGNMSNSDRNYYLRLHAQILANLKDFDDYETDRGGGDVDTPKVTVFDDDTGNEYYGWERPYVFISELVRAFKWDDPADTNDPNTMHRSYGLEIYKRPRTEIFNAVNDNDFRLRIINPAYEITVESGNFEDRGGRFYVRIFDDKDANSIQLEDDVEYSDSPWDGATGVDPNVVLAWDRYLKADPNWSYDIYLGTDHNNVKDANSSYTPPGVTYIPNYANENYDPVLVPDTTYYWRVDDVNDGGEVVRTGSVWEFTTWTEEPNNLETIRSLGDPPVFTQNSEIVLERWVANKTGDQWLEVDRVDCRDIPNTFFNDSEGIESYRRNLSWRKVIKRLWDYQMDHSLGNYRGHFFATGGGLIPLNGHGGFVNAGELGFVYDVDMYDWDINYDTDEDVLIDLTDPNVNILFNYITRMESNDGYHRLKGRININTAPWIVIAQLPWVSKRESGVTLNEPYALAQAITAYRDKLNAASLPGYNGPEYNGINGRNITTGLSDLREEKGFSNIGELTTVINTSSGNHEYDMRYYTVAPGESGNDQFGFPDIHFDERSGADGMTDDLEERNLIFARISDLVTVRSDVFTAYILVRLGIDGPQRRVIAILDRSKVTPSGGKVEVITKYPVPDPR